MKFEKARSALDDSLRRVEDIVSQTIGSQVIQKYWFWGNSKVWPLGPLTIFCVDYKIYQHLINSYIWFDIIQKVKMIIVCC